MPSSSAIHAWSKNDDDGPDPKQVPKLLSVLVDVHQEEWQWLGVVVQMMH